MRTVEMQQVGHDDHIKGFRGVRRSLPQDTPEAYTLLALVPNQIFDRLTGEDQGPGPIRIRAIEQSKLRCNVVCFVPRWR